jgi:hypothetical protein
MQNLVADIQRQASALEERRLLLDAFHQGALQNRPTGVSERNQQTFTHSFDLDEG